MQKELGRVGKISGRSAKRVAPKKAVSQKPVSKRHTVSKRVHGSERIKINRAPSPFIPWGNRTYVLSATSTTVPEASTTTVENTESIVPSRPTMPWKNRSSVLIESGISSPQPSTPTVTDTKTIVPSRSLMLLENRACVLSADGTAISQVSPVTTKKFWRYRMTEIPSMITSFLGWHTYQTRMQQKQMLLQMLVATGSVRPCNVEFRYSTTSEESGSLSRSFAVSPPADIQPSTPLQMFLARSQAGGAQLIQRLRMQETYARLYSRGIQLVERLRRELTARSYLSRI